MLNNPSSPIPVSVLVGFLGAGKTTLINHLLSANHGAKIAIIVNEFGQVNIDAKLVRHTSEKMIEMSNGCICCTLREDLLQELRELSQMNLDYILIESTGIGEPLPIAQTFHMQDLPQKVRLDSIVTVVDCANFWTTWNSSGQRLDADGQWIEEPLAPLLSDQLEFTSVVLLNKADLISQSELLRLESFVQQLNPQAKVLPCVRGQVEAAALMNTGLYDYNQAELAADWLTEWSKPSSEAEEYGFQSWVYQTQHPLSWSAFQTFVAQWPEVCIRAKGFLQFADHPPVLLQQAGQSLEIEVLELQGDAAEPTDTSSELVMIGQGLLRQQAEIALRLNACQASR